MRSTGITRHILLVLCIAGSDYFSVDHSVQPAHHLAVKLALSYFLRMSYHEKTMPQVFVVTRNIQWDHNPPTHIQLGVFPGGKINTTCVKLTDEALTDNDTIKRPSDT